MFFGGKWLYKNIICYQHVFSFPHTIITILLLAFCFSDKIHKENELGKEILIWLMALESLVQGHLTLTHQHVYDKISLNWAHGQKRLFRNVSHFLNLLSNFHRQAYIMITSPKFIKTAVYPTFFLAHTILKAIWNTLEFTLQI